MEIFLKYCNVNKNKPCTVAAHSWGINSQCHTCNPCDTFIPDCIEILSDLTGLFSHGCWKRYSQLLLLLLVIKHKYIVFYTMRPLKLVSLVKFQASPSWGCSPEYHWLKRAFSSALSLLCTYCDVERFWSAYYTCNKVFLLKKPVNRNLLEGSILIALAGVVTLLHSSSRTGSSRSSSARRSPAPSPPSPQDELWGTSCCPKFDTRHMEGSQARGWGAGVSSSEQSMRSSSSASAPRLFPPALPRTPWAVKLTGNQLEGNSEIGDENYLQNTKDGLWNQWEATSLFVLLPHPKALLLSG